MPEKLTDERVTVAQALEYWNRSKSWFHGESARRGWRWTRSEELDLRSGPPMTMDRRAVIRLKRELTGAPVKDRHPNAEHLGGYSQPETISSADIPVNHAPPADYVHQLTLLIKLLESGVITESQFRLVRAELHPD